ncbi:MAG: 5-carboxymethyl-2-hydroxymuconate Delta-isomerase [Noviherbaspirillum sp.]
MPHLTLEYTNNLTDFDARRVLPALNQALAASGHFNEIDIKSRAIALDTYQIGTAAEERAFVYVKLAILSGRSDQTKRELSNALLDLLRSSCKGITHCSLQLCVEVVDIDRSSYAKESSCAT